MSLNGFDEAKAICERAPARGWILRPVHFRLLDIAIVQNDAAGISRQVEVAWGKPEEAFILATLMFHTEQPGQWRKAEELLRRAIELARQYKVVGPQVSGWRHVRAPRANSRSSSARSRPRAHHLVSIPAPLRSPARCRRCWRV